MATALQLRQAERLRTMRARFHAPVARILARYFTAQAERVLARWAKHNPRKAIADDLMPDEEDRILVSLLIAIETEIIMGTGALAADLAGGAQFASEADPRVLALLRQSGQRIRGINDTTRRAVRQTILDGYQRGYSDYQIAHGVPDDGYVGLHAIVVETYSGRADTIARTEVAYASEAAAHDRFDAANVQFVEWADGPGCGIDAHDDAPKANGLIVPLHFASAHALAHPNCRRISLPWKPSFAPGLTPTPIPAIMGAA